jgi:hypothetical protein
MQKHFSPENRAVYDILWQYIIEMDMPQRQCNTAHAVCMLDN